MSSSSQSPWEQVTLLIRYSAEQLQKFVAQIAVIPNLKLDYVVLNAGVLRYPNVSSESTTAMQKSRANHSREPLSCTFPFAEPCCNRLERAP